MVASPTPQGRRPDFLIVGSPKAGTSFFYELLKQHPRVFVSTPKEPSFFSLPDRYELGLEWYEQLFAAAEPGQLAGEASTHYTDGRHSRTVIPRLAESLPDAKLIYLVRHPAKRLFSHYRFYLQEIEWTRARYESRTEEFPDDYRYYFDGKLFRMQDFVNPMRDFRPSFDDFCKMFDGAFVDTGRYFSITQQILEHFPKSQLLVLTAEELFASPQAVLNRGFEHLGLDSVDVTTAVGQNRFDDAVGRTRDVQLRQKVLRSPALKFVAKRVAPEWAKAGFWRAREKLGQRLGGPNEAGIPSLTPEQKQSLVELYRDDNARLAEYLGQSLDAWNEWRS